MNHRQVARIAQVRIGMLPGGAPGPKAILAKSNSYMNTSGGPVKNLMQYFSITPDHLLVIHDELDIPEHELRLKLGGGENGHNGLEIHLDGGWARATMRGCGLVLDARLGARA